MFKSYLSIAFRNLVKNRFFSLFNIGSLSLGLCASAFILLYLNHELSYDSFNRNADQIYRISGKQRGTWFSSLTTSHSNAMIAGNFPEMKSVVRLRNYLPKFFYVDDKKFHEAKVLITDPGSHFFNLFDFKFKEGNSQKVLNQSNSVVLTAEIAKKFFGNQLAIGKQIVYDTLPLTVTGVIEEVPSNSHLDFSVIISHAKPMDAASGTFTYCMISPNVNIQNLKAKILSLETEIKKEAALEDIKIMPLLQLHFDTDNTFELKPAGNKIYLFLFTSIGIIIIILSCINYTNLSIAMYADRTREIAVRKSVGAHNTQLSAQFLTETVLLSVLTVPITLALIEFALPLFNDFMGTRIVNSFIYTPQWFLLLFSIAVVLGILSGFYPAWILPKMKATLLFKKDNIKSLSGLNLRKALITFQVTALVVMGSTTWIIRQQLHYIQNKDLGFQKEGVLKLKGAWRVDSSQYKTFKTELLKYHSILSVSYGFVPGDEDYGNSFRAEDSNDAYSNLISYGVDYDYFKTLGIELLETDFDPQSEKAPARLRLINETLAKQLGYLRPVGRKIILDPNAEEEKTLTINGVFRDFHFLSLHQPLVPVLLSVRSFRGSPNILVKINTSNLQETMTFIKKKTDAFIPNIPLTFEFVNESLNRLYDKEQKLAALCQQLLVITIFLSFMGLVGLTSYIIGTRTKEMGIRKILGASIINLFKILVTPFMSMVFVATLTGSSISFTLILWWLQSFSYKISLSGGVFAGTTLILSVMIVLLVTIQTIKMHRFDLVKALKSE